LNKTPEANRLHISIVGRRNVGKSSLLNAITGQEISIVSDTPGTTTDPVKKAVELLPYGPVVLIDTAGIDDVGELGEKRISKTIKALSQSDFAILVFESFKDPHPKEIELINLLKKINVPFIAALNKSELGVSDKLLEFLFSHNIKFWKVSCSTNEGIEEFKVGAIKSLPALNEPPLVADLVKQGDIAVLVVPIDLGAPKGRLILPQVQTIREILDSDAVAIVCKEKELRATLDRLNEKPKLVVTDSQAIMKVYADIPNDVNLTTFSILMARHKGDLPTLVKGLKQIEKLENGDKILIAEACSHHAQEDDIGTVKIPRWLRNFTRKDLKIDIVHGGDFPQNLTEYKLIIHCGGCMLNRKAMLVRINQANLMGVPIVNYGVLISYLHGALPKAIEIFPEALEAYSN
jgi:[FeFe] hydrogenase H-cluster maturation GTPase HydF